MKLVSSVLFIVILISSAFGDCGFSLTTPVLNYTATDLNPALSQSFSLYRHSGGPQCDNVVVGFSRGGSATYARKATNILNGATVSYNIYKESTALTELRKQIDATSSNQVITGTISRKETKNLDYFFKLGLLTSGIVTRAGTYSDTIQVEASEGAFTDGAIPEVTQPFLVNIVVPTSISISLVDSGSPHDTSSTSKVLDFGELVENKELGFDVRIVSNAGYNLSVSSANNQKLQLLGAPENISNQISYDFYAANGLKNLTSSSAGAVSIGTGPGSTPAEGAIVPIRVVIKSVDNKNSGNYNDYVTFTVITTE